MRRQRIVESAELPSAAKACSGITQGVIVLG